MVQWAIKNAQRPVVTTNFRPYEASILNVCTTVKKDIPVIWCDSGYNTPNTYKHAEIVIELLDLDIKLYVPKQTSSHRDVIMGVPDIQDPRHKIFTEQVKLEPFKRAMKEPFYYYSDEELDVYMEKNTLPNEFKYFDPTKVLNNRECGIHTK
ncbi:phosphoadenylylsulfate reductase [Flavobacteriaceae bacterium (ex Bugula neritina AB1)]|nr:phosphoadenylylsulfate reductase [Flavobacteriaceae bacterium (ex Bugula neritina AB1)]